MSFLLKLRGVASPGKAVFQWHQLQFMDQWHLTPLHSTSYVLIYAAIIVSFSMMLGAFLTVYFSGIERLLCYAIRTTLKVTFGKHEIRDKPENDSSENDEQYSKPINKVGWKPRHLYISNLKLPQKILTLMSMPPIKFDSFVVAYCGMTQFELLFDFAIFGNNAMLHLYSKNLTLVS